MNSRQSSRASTPEQQRQPLRPPAPEIDRDLERWLSAADGSVVQQQDGVRDLDGVVKHPSRVPSVTRRNPPTPERRGSLNAPLQDDRWHSSQGPYEGLRAAGPVNASCWPVGPLRATSGQQLALQVSGYLTM